MTSTLTNDVNYHQWRHHSPMTSPSGGLACCRHLETLLDTDQTVPPQLLQYHQKYRVWFQDYTAANATTNTSASHADLDRLYTTTEAFAGEYDVPPVTHRSLP